MEHDPQPEAYLLHAWIRDIHPMLWRRFLVRSDSTLADLHFTLQIGFAWTDFQRFRIQKKVLNGELRETFARWYPGMRTDQEMNLVKKAA